jgi:hypothetical protein
MSEKIKLMWICFPFSPTESLPEGKAQQCSGCGKTVWGSNSSLKRMKDSFPDYDFAGNPPEVFCMGCAQPRMVTQALKGNEVKINLPSSEQFEELRKVMNKNNPNVN